MGTLRWHENLWIGEVDPKRGKDLDGISDSRRRITKLLAV